MLGPLSVFFVVLVTVFTCYFLAIKMINIKRIVYSSIEHLQRKRQLHSSRTELSPLVVVVNSERMSQKLDRRFFSTNGFRRHLYFQRATLKAGTVERRNGGMVERRNGGMAEWWNGGMAEWQNGGMAEWRNGGK